MRPVPILLALAAGFAPATPCARASTAIAFESFEGPGWTVNGSPIGVQRSPFGAFGWVGPITARLSTNEYSDTLRISNQAPMHYSAAGLRVDGGSRYLSLSGLTLPDKPVHSATLTLHFAERVYADADLFFSFLIRFRGTLAYDVARLTLGSSEGDAGNSQPRFGVLQGKPTGELGVGSGRLDVSAVACIPDTVYFAVVRAVSNGSRWTSTELYLNPASTQMPAQPTAVAVENSSTEQIRVLTLNLSNAEAEDGFDIDAISFGRTWEDVLSHASSPVSER